MKRLFTLSLVVLISLPASAQELYRININRVCATIVNIPYASDNFTDEEWEQFKKCLIFMRQFKE
jgi:abortive infection bacteriophage resistance protein